MSAVELDPVFVKALKFLHSKAKDSGAQLKALLDDAIAQRKGLKVIINTGDLGKSSPGRSKSEEDLKRKEAEKRSAERNVKDSSEPDIKKAKLDSKSKSKDERDIREKEKEKERAKREKEKKEKEERDAHKLKEKIEKERKEKEFLSSKIEPDTPLVISDEEEPASRMDAGDFALEMGIACVVCKQFDVSSGNQLVECQECHSLYHQECHKPPVTEEDVSDPRFVWYCSRCSRSLKKMMTQKPAKAKPPTPTITSGKEPSATPSKSTKSDTSSKNVSQAFRRIDPKTIVTPTDTTTLTSTTVKPMVGLAGLAANLHKSKGESKSGTTSRKSDQKGDVKASTKVESKSGNGGYKSDSSSKSGSSSSNKSDIPSKPKLEEKKVSTKVDDKKSNDSTLKSSTVEKEEKKADSVLKLEKTPEPGKSPSNYEQNKSDVTPPKSSPQHVSTTTKATTPDCPSPSKVSSSTSNKQAVANLSLLTANKRIQMMKKKAQAKPGADKKVHIK
ncbi:hypothetical protein BsWGS_20291 [Bradybaena similaris]